MLLEKTQRRFCRLLFCLGCVLPTLALAGWTTIRLSPGYDAALLISAEDCLGARIDCGGMWNPKPSLFELVEVRLHDRESGESIATCDRVRLQRVAETWRFHAHDLRISSDRPVHWLRSLVRSELVSEGKISTLRFEGVASDPLRLDEVRFKLEQRDDQAKRQLLLRSRDHVAITLVESFEGLAAGTRLTVESSDRFLPSRLVTCPILDGIAEDALRFRGRFEATLSSDRYATDGRFVGAVRFAGSGSDEAEWASGGLKVRELTWSGPRVERLDARLELRDGVLSRRLVLGMHHSLGCEAFPTLREQFATPDRVDPIAFTQAACEIELNEEGLTLIAGCGEIDERQRGSAVAHAILEHDGAPLLREPGERNLPMAGLIRALWHGSPAELPADAGAQEAARRLPNQSGSTLR